MGIAQGHVCDHDPHFESLVPAASDDHLIVGGLDPVYRLDGGSMLGHVYRLVGLEVPQLARLVTRGSQDLGTILRGSQRKDLSDKANRIYILVETVTIIYALWLCLPNASNSRGQVLNVMCVLFSWLCYPQPRNNTPGEGRGTV